MSKLTDTRENMNSTESGSTNKTVALVKTTPSHEGVNSVALTIQQPSQAFKVELENPTDWPTVLATLTVGIGSILTSLIVGWLSVLSQRSQVRSNIANFRNSWIHELRQLSAKFISKAAIIAYELKHNSSYLHSKNSNQVFSELMEIHAHIILMLDPKKKLNTELGEIMTELIEALNNNNFVKMNASAQAFTHKSSEILENGWKDIKNDLRNKSFK